VARGVRVIVHVKEGVRMVCDKPSEWRGFGLARRYMGEPSAGTLGSGVARGKVARRHGIGRLPC
jgi:hypothetical protein